MSNGALYSLVGVMALVVSVIQIIHVSPVFTGKATSTAIAQERHHAAARNALEEARTQGQLFGDVRREEVRRWVHEAGLQGVGKNIGHGPGADGEQKLSRPPKPKDIPSRQDMESSRLTEDE